KKGLVGVLQLDTDPIGAEVLLDGVSIGPAPINDREVLAGTHTLRVQREGFNPAEEQVQVTAGARLERSLKLVPNARGIRVVTSPRDVKVLVDGEEKGATFGRAGPGYTEILGEMGVSPGDASEPLLVPNLAPGPHTMLLHKECYEDVKVSLTIEVDPNDNEPVAYKPFVLVPSRGGVKIASEPPGAQVYLDGSLSGKAPVELHDLCTGRHEVRMEAEGLGRWSGGVDVLKDQTADVSERLRLSLAAFDLRPGIPVARSLVTALGGVQRYNVVSPGNGVPDDLAERVRLETESTRGKGIGAQALKDLRAAMKVEMIALALPSGGTGDRVELLLYGPLHEQPDRRILQAGTEETFRGVAAALDRELPVQMPWSGIKLIDIRGSEHPVILDVSPGSPAATAGITSGESLVSMGGADIRLASDFAAALSKASPGAPTTVKVQDEKGTHDVDVVMRTTPVMLPLEDPEILYNKAIADLRQQAALAAGDKVAEGYAWMNVGLALMHFGEMELAIRDGFHQAELPDGAGISLGTIRYLTGLCYERLGLKTEAKTAFDQAAASPASTTGTNDGPLVAPSAKLRASSLGASS
ncbi:MAG TPA: PEGA domain-containing protein, partial [Candidatus Saccharimonadales bacterium]|nr:PEGA domain-containing protein [Candidatus Saccharimonadales bacterium]